MERGFTLIELLVVLSITVALCGSVLAVSLQDIPRSHAQADEEVLITSLMHARAQALNDTCFGIDCTQARAHGVAFFLDHLIVFQTPTSTSPYAHRDTPQDEYHELAALYAIQGLHEVTFLPRSGNPVSAGKIVLNTASGYAISVTVHPNGRIDW